MRLVTYNLRYDSQPDNLTVQQSLDALPDPLAEPPYLRLVGEQPWSLRRLRVAQDLLSEGVVLAGLQEALLRQVNDLAELFGSDWDWVGLGRDDGKEAGEFSPIFYKTSDLTLISSDSFWTSNTPFVPSKFPGAGSFRVCTVAHLQPRNDGTKFTVLNTHMDERSEPQRKLAASLILARARYEAVTTDAPVFVMGDLNSAPTGGDSGAYEIITGARPPVALPADFAAKYAVDEDKLPNFTLLDLREQAPRRAVSNNYATFTGFTASNDTRSWVRIDFIFGGSNLGWKATGYKVGSARSDDGTLASDHRPVFADVSI
ncbi:Endonuclease/exonuclease/phosphatase [Mycena rebaudengoi]|nr:Endonuclease/exonuclease/phosphatase [Mycena rebaudengoi]